MRLRLASLSAAALAFPLIAGAAPAFKATLTARTHTPKVNAKWVYVVRATDPAGKALKATITSQIVDPYGGVHAVEFGCCKNKFVTNRPFTGVFRDYVEYPPESQGFRLTFRVTVKALGAKRVLTYWIKSS
jgi:hypothetical protein